MNIQNFLQEVIQNIINSESIIANSLIKTFALLCILLVVRAVLTRNIKTSKAVDADRRRRWLAGIKNVTLLLFLLGLFFIWGYQLRALALSLAALAVALVLSFKEIITNFMGGLSRAISQQYNVGNRIVIGNFRGDVVSANMLTTVIMEIGPGTNFHQYTGCTITIPNSMLLNTPIVNESYMQEYMLHIFHVPLKLTDNWRKAEKMLIRATNEVCEPYINRARQYIEYISRKISLEPPSSTPRISIVLTKPDEMDLIVRLPVPSRREGKIEQEVLRRYLDLMEETKD